MANGPEPLDASRIANRLYVGGKPPFDRDLPEIDVLVLCAEEIQPQRPAFHGRVIHCPLPDAALDQPALVRALTTGRAVADELVAGKRVLVTCAMGINRSALVACLALGLVTEMTPQQLVANVRAKRNPKCLSNEHFVKILGRYLRNGTPTKRPVANGGAK